MSVKYVVLAHLYGCHGNQEGIRSSQPPPNESP